MVVSVETQRIHRKHSSGKGFAAPALQVSRRPVPLYILPFITALFIFSIFLNTFDLLWDLNEPTYQMETILLPEEYADETDEVTLLRASAPYAIPHEGVKDNRATARGVVFSEYRVRGEDRYSIIAEKFNISLDALISINGLRDGTILEGDILKIPSESGIYYKVTKGDTLSSISRKFEIDVDRITETNDLVSTVIHVEDVLFIPGATLPAGELEGILGEKFTIPAAGSVKDNYGSYIDPVTGLKNYNYGIDIVNKKGTAVFAGRDGVVGNTSYNSYYGRVIQLNHSGSMQSIYSSLDSIIVKPGEKVLRGDLLGYMGNSGFKAGEHLQFSIFKNKEDVDTLDFIF